MKLKHLLDALSQLDLSSSDKELDFVIKRDVDGDHLALILDSGELLSVIKVDIA